MAASIPIANPASIPSTPPIALPSSAPMTWAQEALMGGEIVATHDLNGAELDPEQSQDQQIVQAARESGQKWRGLLPW